MGPDGAILQAPPRRATFAAITHISTDLQSDPSRAADEKPTEDTIGTN